MQNYSEYPSGSNQSPNDTQPNPEWVYENWKKPGIQSNQSRSGSDSSGNIVIANPETTYNEHEMGGVNLFRSFDLHVPSSPDKRHEDISDAGVFSSRIGALDRSSNSP